MASASSSRTSPLLKHFPRPAASRAQCRCFGLISGGVCNRLFRWRRKAIARNAINREGTEGTTESLFEDAGNERIQFHSPITATRMPIRKGFRPLATQDKSQLCCSTKLRRTCSNRLLFFARNCPARPCICQPVTSNKISGCDPNHNITKRFTSTGRPQYCGNDYVCSKGSKRFLNAQLALHTFEVQAEIGESVHIWSKLCR